MVDKGKLLEFGNDGKVVSDSGDLKVGIVVLQV